MQRGEGGSLGGRGCVGECGGLGLREGASYPVEEGGDWNCGWLWSPVGPSGEGGRAMCVLNRKEVS